MRSDDPKLSKQSQIKNSSSSRKRRLPTNEVGASCKELRRSPLAWDVRHLANTFKSMLMNDESYREALVQSSATVFKDLRNLFDQELKLRKKAKELSSKEASEHSQDDNQMLQSLAKQINDARKKKETLLGLHSESSVWDQVYQKIKKTISATFNEAVYRANDTLFHDYYLNPKNNDSAKHLIDLVLKESPGGHIKESREILLLLLKHLYQYVSEKHQNNMESFFEKYKKRGFRASFNNDFLSNQAVQKAFSDYLSAKNHINRSGKVTGFVRTLEPYLISTTVADKSTAEPGGARAIEQSARESIQQASLPPEQVKDLAELVVKKSPNKKIKNHLRFIELLIRYLNRHVAREYGGDKEAFFEEYNNHPRKRIAFEKYFFQEAGVKEALGREGNKLSLKERRFIVTKSVDVIQSIIVPGLPDKSTAEPGGARVIEQSARKSMQQVSLPPHFSGSQLVNNHVNHVVAHHVGQPAFNNNPQGSQMPHALLSHQRAALPSRFHPAYAAQAQRKAMGFQVPMGFPRGFPVLPMNLPQRGASRSMSLGSSGGFPQPPMNPSQSGAPGFMPWSFSGGFPSLPINQVQRRAIASAPLRARLPMPVPLSSERRVVADGHLATLSMFNAGAAKGKETSARKRHTPNASP